MSVRAGPAEVVALARKGVLEIAFSLASDIVGVEAVLRKYADRPISLADACLIRSADLHEDARVFTFDSDFRIYRWARNRKFELV